MGGHGGEGGDGDTPRASAEPLSAAAPRGAVVGAHVNVEETADDDHLEQLDDNGQGSQETSEDSSRNSEASSGLTSSVASVEQEDVSNAAGTAD